MIYLNNAAVTVQKPEGVRDAAPVPIDTAKSMVAQFLGVKSPENVIFTQSGESAMELALRAFIRRGDHVIATVLEQDSTFAALQSLSVAAASAADNPATTAAAAENPVTTAAAATNPATAASAADNSAVASAIDQAADVVANPAAAAATSQATDGVAAAPSDAGITVSLVGVDPYGSLRYDEIEALIRPNTRAIVCAQGCAVTGNITDLEQVGSLARRYGLLLIVDGCQAVGACDINLESLGVDAYCFDTHRKIMGPYGVGVLCLKEGLHPALEAGLAAAIEGGTLPGREAGLGAAMNDASQTNPAVVIGQAGAAENPAGSLQQTDAEAAAIPWSESAGESVPRLLASMAPAEEKLGQLCAALEFIREKGIYGISIFPHRLAKRFFESVSSMDAVKVYGDFGTGSRIPTVSIGVDGFTPAQVKEHMAKKYGIVVKDGLHDAVHIHEALGTAETGLTRFSFGYFNTRRDVNDAIWALMDLLNLDDLYLLS